MDGEEEFVRLIKGWEHQSVEDALNCIVYIRQTITQKFGSLYNCKSQQRDLIGRQRLHEIGVMKDWESVFFKLYYLLFDETFYMLKQFK